MKRYILFLFALVVAVAAFGQEAGDKKKGKETKKEEAKKEEAKEGEKEEPEHWHLAEKGLKSFEQKNYQQALEELAEAIKYTDEFEDDDKARVHFHYAKCVQKTTKGDDFFFMAKLHRSYSEAAKYGSGMYKRESQIHVDDYIDGMDRSYPDAIDRLDVGELNKEEAELLLYGAELLNLPGEVAKVKAYIMFLDSKK